MWRHDGRRRWIRLRAIDERIDHQAESQGDPETEQHLDAARGAFRELGAVILVAEVVAVFAQAFLRIAHPRNVPHRGAGVKRRPNASLAAPLVTG